jgi:hypothetical protein
MLTDLHLRPYETVFFHYELLRNKHNILVTDLATATSPKTKWPMAVVPSSPAIGEIRDKPTQVISTKSNFVTTVRSTGPQANQELAKRRRKMILDQCFCPQEFKSW